jgi:CHAT domain-containing protein
MTAAERETERLLTDRLSTLNLNAVNTHPGTGESASLLRDLTVARSDLRVLYEQIYARSPQASLERRSEIRTLARDLPEGLLFCEYVITSDEVILFVLEPSAAAHPLSTYRIPIKKDELRRRVESFTKLLSKADLNFERPSRELFDLLLAPVASRLSRHKVVAIAPDGVLWRLPFAALIDESGRYVIEKTAISYAPSLQVLIELERARGAARTQTVLAVGNPTIDSSVSASVASVYRGLSLGPLPEAETEVQALARIYGRENATILTGTDATETVVIRDAPNHAVLHFATHGIFDDVNPMYSRLLFARSAKGGDGFLEAWEIANSRIDADLVVLSACDTALGRETNGEGLIGMTWAFFVAGARSVVSTQWKVDSESASQLMVTFHRGLHNPAASGQTARALRHSQLSLIRDSRYRHPYYWGAYSLTGATRISGPQNRSHPTIPAH